MNPQLNVLFSMKILKNLARASSRYSSASRARADIWNSGIFDEEIYRQQYADLRGTSFDLANHYLEYGAREQKNPHPLFDTEFYLQNYPDVKDAGINPLLHYVRSGGVEHRRPHIMFDVQYYIEQIDEEIRDNVNPLAHYLNLGWRLGLRPNGFFSPSWYLSRYPDVAEAGIEPFTHYIINLARSSPENRQPSEQATFAGEEIPEDFNEQLYALLNPDVHAAVEANTFKSGADHWLQWGAYERRRYKLVLPLDFDEQQYLDTHPDVANAVATGAVASGAAHWLMRGAIEGRRGWSKAATTEAPSEFDEASYLSENPDVSAAINRFEWESGLSHWCLSGSAGRHAFSLQNGRSRAAQNNPPSDADANSHAPIMPNGFQPSAYAKHYPDLSAALGDDAKQLFQHWIDHGCVEGRIGFGLRQYEGRSRTHKYRSRRNAVSLYGFFDAPSGLGAAARGYRNALIAAGYEVDSITIKLDKGRFKTTPDVRSNATGNSPVTNNKVNIFLLNADMVQLFFWDDRLHILDETYNVGVWVWELAHFRSDWVSCFGAFDEIWAPSEFCRSAFAASSPIPVLTIPYVVEVAKPETVFPKSYFQILPDTYVFGSIFDVGSVVERKNPELTIRGFIAAFGDREDVTLVMKYHSAGHYPDEIERLHKLASGRSNIVFIGRTISENELYSLKMHINCLVSPHRSEGFGLNIAESMICGRTVIATNYSGNTDFSDETNSYPLRYHLIEIERNIGPYTEGSLWADADYNDLVRQMRTVVNHPGEAGCRAQKAVKDISEKYNVAAIASKIRARFEELRIFESPEWAVSKASPNRSLAYKDVYPLGPKITIVVPVYNIEPRWLKLCIESVRKQTYSNWELVLHDDGSTRVDTIELLNCYSGLDHRIKVSFGSRNLGISAATNTAIGLSSGSFIAFLDNDDELSVDAMEAMAKAISTDSEGDLFYSDEDKIDLNGNFCDHYCKPDWSPEHMESSGYLLHLVVIRRALLLEIGGLRQEFSGAQDFDLTLRATRVARKVVHVPKVLYHWRMVPGSAAAVVDAKPVALIRAAEALQDHLDASGRDSLVEPGLLTGLFRVRDRLPAKLPVTLVIPTDNRNAEVDGRGMINLFDNFLESILSRTVTDCEVRLLAVDNGNLSAKQVKTVERNNGRVISYPGPRSPFSMAKKINFTLPHIETEQIIILNDDMEVISPGWVDALMELSQRPTSGVVGARLLYPDNRIQHCGMVFGINDHVAHIFHQFGVDQVGYNGYTHIIRNYLAVTGACMATKRSIFNEVGGFDEDFAVDYNDTDFCLRVHSVGYRNIYTPFATLYHFEGTTAVRSEPNPREHDLFVRRWKKFMERDPFYNPNLTKTGYDFALA